MNHILKFVIKIGLFTAGIGFVMPTTPTSAKISLWPTSFYIGIDMFRFCNNFFEENIADCPTDSKYYEFNASFDISRIMLEGDWGRGIIDRIRSKDGISKNKKASSTEGNYFRIGFNYNLLSNTRHKNAVFFGIRYAKSFFKFNFEGQQRLAQEDTLGPSINRSRQDVKARWWEIVGGGKVKVFSLFYIGCTLRYKFAKKLYNNEHVLPFDILGWGLGEDDDCFGYNLYFTVRIPLYNDLKNIQSKKKKEEKTTTVM